MMQGHDDAESDAELRSDLIQLYTNGTDYIYTAFASKSNPASAIAFVSVTYSAV